MRVIIDRFEGDFAVVELDNKKFVNMPTELLPIGVKEGSVISIELDQSETEKRSKRITKLMNDLWED